MDDPYVDAEDEAECLLCKCVRHTVHDRACRSHSHLNCSMLRALPCCCSSVLVLLGCSEIVSPTWLHFAIFDMLLLLLLLPPRFVSFRSKSIHTQHDIRSTPSLDLSLPLAHSFATQGALEAVHIKRRNQTHSQQA